jgi:hypothetical protein
MDLGQVPVEDDDVVLIDGDPVECRRSVVRDVHGECGLPEPLGDGVGQPDLIFDHQYAHLLIISERC